MEHANLEPDQSNESVLLVTNPDSRGFIYKYILGFSPIFLVIICLILRTIMYGITQAFFPGVTTSLAPFIPSMSELTEITVLMIAPVGIFAFFMCVGWVLRLNELLTGAALALGLSGIAGILLANGMGVVPMSTKYMLYLFEWVAFLIQPFSVIATVIVIVWTEKFRRSIIYTITKEGVRIKGGVWKQQEHLLPHLKIGRVVMEQDLPGRFFHVGTIVPIGIAQWGSEMSIRGVGFGGLKDDFSAGLSYAKAQQEGSQYPLDCLYGIREPEKAMALLEQMIYRPAERQEEQVAILKKINKKI
jgi:hypothetical protein